MAPLPELKVPGRISYRINHKCESIYNAPAFPDISTNETPRNKKFEIVDTAAMNRVSQGTELLKKAMMKETKNSLNADQSYRNSINKSDLGGTENRNSKSIQSNVSEQGSRISVRKTLPVAHRLIGTPDYMAPEIIKGYTVRHPSVDWWSVGVIMFELITGIPPFNADNVETIFDNIVNLRIPWEDIEIGEGEDQMKPEAADLIKQLLNLDHTKRITAAEIKKHSWFAGIDWANIRKGDGPIIPQQTSELDTANFRRMQNSKEENPFLMGHKESLSGDELKEFMKKLRSEDDSQFTMSRYDILDLANRDLYEVLKQQKESKAKAELKSFKEKEKIHEHELNEFNSSFEIDERSMGTISRRGTDFIVEEEDIIEQ